MFGKTADKTKSCCVGDSCTGGDFWHKEFKEAWDRHIKAVESLKKFHAAEMAKLQGQIDALKDATLREEPEKPMRTWKVTTNDGQKHKVTAQQYGSYDDIFRFGNEIPTSVIRIASGAFSGPYLYREMRYETVAEFMYVTSIIEVTE